MLTFRNILAQYLVRINHLEVIGESIRQNISKNPYFQYETIFQRMDKYHKGYLIPADLSEFMFENKIYPTEQELYVIFKDFDQNRIGSITLDKFAEEILPQQHQKLKKQALSKKYYRSGVRLELDLQFLVSKYFEHKIQVYNQLSQIRARLSEVYPLIGEQSFSLLDKQRKLYFTLRDVDTFLRTTGKVLKPQEIVRIFKVLNQQKSFSQVSNVRTTFNKFIQQIEPLSQGYYLGYAQRLAQKSLIQTKHIERKLRLEEQSLRNSKKQIQAQYQIEHIRNSRRHLQNILLQKQIQLSRSHLIEEQLRRKYY